MDVVVVAVGSGREMALLDEGEEVRRRAVAFEVVACLLVVVVVVDVVGVVAVADMQVPERGLRWPVGMKMMVAVSSPPYPHHQVVEGPRIAAAAGDTVAEDIRRQDLFAVVDQG